ncbi:ATPase family AAA domain-containing protein [Camellia lanceoleosa]|uniref:ATPase family AAA domain-containing protein n=1 Tax=Camellia lanceoleosa TaxID=1840588 RepID=A0ACC0GRN0_9ERIC|nr:ATPase family AAA domain-containing protein [Camellia lanceoleosa]
MYSKRSGEGVGPVSKPVRTSDRLRRRPKIYGRPYLYYAPAIIRSREARLRQEQQLLRLPRCCALSVVTNLRCSTRKRRISVNLEDYTDSSGMEDNDLMVRNWIDNSASQDDFSSHKRKKVLETRSLPRREGLRPRCSKAVAREQLIIESDDEQDTSEEKVGQDGTENGNDVEDNDADDGEGQDVRPSTKKPYFGPPQS